MVDVSLIVPVYKVEKYLSDSVKSMLAQTHRNIEVILVDDGSPDNSGKICDEIAALDNRVKVIHKQNAGAGYARNDGMDIATGEYLYFCDPDDYIDEHLVEDNLKIAREADADIVVFGYRTVWVDEDGNHTSAEEVSLPKLSGVYTYEEFWNHFREECGLPYSLAWRMFRREYVFKNHLRHTNFSNGQDAHFVFDTYATPFSRIAYNQKAYYDYIRHAESSTTLFKPKRIENEYLVSKKYEKVIRECPYAKGRYDDLINRKYVMGMCLALSNLSRSDASLSTAQKVDFIKSILEKPEMKKALKEIKLSVFTVPTTKIKVLLLKLSMFKTVIKLGEAYEKSKR